VNSRTGVAVVLYQAEVDDWLAGPRVVIAGLAADIRTETAELAADPQFVAGFVRFPLVKRCIFHK